MRFKLQRSQDSSQPYYFEIQAAGNHETLATSETYVAKADAQHAIDLIMAGAATATVVDVT
ncbi:MAG: YegP family protein [Actinobacteria bacterium]|nr:YegP family protein [Actinomycetota bacterium]